MQYQTVDHFFSGARQLRRIFDQRFDDPLKTHNQRFVWDYWHVPKQYTLLRTPAFSFFPQKLYARFHRHMVEWGRANLGCHDISPPWLSCYVQGCRQELHSDVPHGPLAFVYSLTHPEQRHFTGGETFLWSKRRVKIVPRFNRLTIFNPAISHGVREVRGTHDPREGRLVIHGWFVNPRPFWYGALNATDMRRTLDLGLAEVAWDKIKGSGFLSVRVNITAAGQVSRTRVLVNTLVGGAGTGELERSLKLFKFNKKRSGTVLTLPLMLD